MEELNFYQTKLIKVIKKICFSDDIPDFLISSNLRDTPDLDIRKVSNPNLTIYAMRSNHEVVGIAFFLKEDEHKTRVDVAFLKRVRGNISKRLAILTLNEYIDVHKPHILWGEITKSNRRSLVFSQWLNFKLTHEDEHKFYVERRPYGRNDGPL